jgi:hypothetical protein
MERFHLKTDTVSLVVAMVRTPEWRSTESTVPPFPNRFEETERSMSLPRLLHIVNTDFRDDEVLVRFSDGTSAVYDAEELEKLRPRRKYIEQPLGVA